MQQLRRIKYDDAIVQVRELHLKKLPDWRPVLTDLPIGVGVKGGVARKILKVVAGLTHDHQDFRAELTGDGDLDILVAVPVVTPALRRELRHHFVGQSFGGMILEAKDIEVSDSLETYFRKRDVTMNEVLVLRTSVEEFLLFYTTDALEDVQNGVISPSCRCLHTGFSQSWFWDETTQQAVLAVKPLTRCLIRYLKGHGIQYGIAAPTWQYYREVRPLPPADLFKVLKVFVGDDDKFAYALQHLKDIGLVDAVVDGNALWGDAIYDMNQRLARYGRRLTFTEPDADQIEDWLLQKESQYQAWLERRNSRFAVGWPVEEDGCSAVTFPPDVGPAYPAVYQQFG